jgi:hypothetical protein
MTIQILYHYILCKGNHGPVSLDVEMNKVWQGIQSKSIKE